MVTQQETFSYDLNLQEEGTLILRESRMIIPGIQAIFGFQLIAVFSEGFGERLQSHHEIIHLMAMLLVLISIALVMSPAVFQRRVEPRKISASFIKLASKMLTLGLKAFTLGLAADVGVITYAVTGKESAAATLGFLTLGFLVWLWFFFGSPLQFNTGSHLDKSFKLFHKLGSSSMNQANSFRLNVVNKSQLHIQRFKTAVLNTGYKYLN